MLYKVENQYDVSVKILGSNNRKEFFNSKCHEWISSLGVIHQSSLPYTPQQNGIVKKKHRHILEVARAFKFQNGVPHKFWGDCVRTVIL